MELYKRNSACQARGNLNEATQEHPKGVKSLSRKNHVTCIVREKRGDNINSLKEALLRGDTKCGSSCSLVPLVYFFSLHLLT